MVSRPATIGSGRVVAEQVGGDPVGHAQRAGQERPVGVLDDQRGRRRRAGRPGRAASAPCRGRPRARGRRRQSSSARPGARPAARDVVVEVAVEALEARLEVGRQGDEEQLDVEAVRPKPRARRRRRMVAPASSAASAQRLEVGRGRVRLPSGGGATGAAGGGPVEQAVDLGLRDVQAPEAVGRVGVVGPPPGNGRRPPRAAEDRPDDRGGSAGRARPDPRAPDGSARSARRPARPALRPRPAQRPRPWTRTIRPGCVSAPAVRRLVGRRRRAAARGGAIRAGGCRRRSSSPSGVTIARRGLLEHRRAGPLGHVDHERRGDDQVERRLQLAAERRPESAIERSCRAAGPS